MHLVIAGPYEVLYTTAVDIWSFGCLLLNMLIGKCGPLKQRGVSIIIYVRNIVVLVNVTYNIAICSSYYNGIKSQKVLRD